MLKIEDATPGTRIKVVQDTGVPRLNKQVDQATIKQVIGEALIVRFDGCAYNTYLNLDSWCKYLEVIE